MIHIRWILSIAVLFSSNNSFGKIRGPIAPQSSPQQTQQDGQFDKTRVLEIRTKVLSHLDERIKKDDTIISYGDSIMEDNRIVQATAKALGKNFTLTSIPPDYQEAVERKMNRSGDCFASFPFEKMAEQINLTCKPELASASCLHAQSEIENRHSESRRKWDELRENAGAFTQMKALHDSLIMDINTSIDGFTTCERVLDSTVYSPACMNSYESVFDDQLVQLIANSCTRESVIQNFELYIEFASGLASQPAEAKAAYNSSRIKAIQLGETLFQINAWLKEVKPEFFKKPQRAPANAPANDEIG